jgi:hypothetical protein
MWIRRLTRLRALMVRAVGSMASSITTRTPRVHSAKQAGCVFTHGAQCVGIADPCEFYVLCIVPILHTRHNCAGDQQACATQSCTHQHTMLGTHSSQTRALLTHSLSTNWSVEWGLTWPASSPRSGIGRSQWTGSRMSKASRSGQALDSGTFASTVHHAVECNGGRGWKHHSCTFLIAIWKVVLPSV